MNLDPEAPFDIVIPFRNHPEWLIESVESALAQTANVRSVAIYDDASDDDHARLFIGKERVFYVRKPGRTGQLETLKMHHEFIRDYARDRGWPAGITVRLDGDDFLYGAGALERVRELYRKPRTVATYGGAFAFPSGEVIFPVIRHRNIFPRRWGYGNVHTWRQELWDLARARFGDCFNYPLANPPGWCTASDVATFIPMARVAYDSRACEAGTSGACDARSSGWRVRGCFHHVYAWRYHAENEQRLRRASQVAEERRIFDIVERIVADEAHKEAHA